MKTLAVMLLIFAVVAQVMTWISDVKWSGLYARYRDLDHMPADTQPRREHRMWGITGIWSYRVRNISGIAGVVTGVLAFLI